MSKDALLVGFAVAVALLVMTLLVLAVAWAVHAQARRRHVREVQGCQQASAWALRRYEALEAECAHLVEARLPALVDAVARSHPGVVMPGLRHGEFAGSAAARSFEQVEVVFRDAVAVVRTDVGLAARAGVRAVAEEAQTHLARCQMKVFEEFDKHPTDSPHHQVLMDFDHLVTLAIHEVQRLRILAGSWAGAQRADCTLREIIQSAKGRIRAFERVDYAYLPDTGEVFVEGRVVEPVTVALAELLSNATRWSPGRVSVAVLRAQTGFCVQVDDYGAGLNAFQRDKAQRLLSQDAVLDVANLRHDRKLGFPVIGRLASEYGFAVDVNSPSAGGGVRAVLRVPTALLADLPALPGEAPTPLPATPQLAASPAELTSPPRPAPRSPVPEPAVMPELAGTAPLALPVWPGTGPETAHKAVDGFVDGAVDSPAPTAGGGPGAEPARPAPGSTTPTGLPKRQRRTPQPRSHREAAARMTVIDTSDPDQVAERLSGVGRVIQASLADIDEGDQDR